ncbi:MAG: enoyl-CoA hydratase/isomerase family protein [SAR324 cluster bacterium]|nr:enoyl-CoA hydratase/isomerase family protein [SAR324 cluster bacterium]
MKYEEIRFSTDGAIARLTLANPSKINALSIRMTQEMIHALNSVADDETVKVVIIAAEGKNFSAGHYLPEMIHIGVKEVKHIFDECTRMMQLIHAIPQPVIGQIQGIATAAGCQLAAWCDLVVASEDARFATPGVRIGLFCSTPMVAVTRAIGRKAAMEMLLTGRYFPAEEAKALGLVNRVVPLSDLVAETDKLAKEIATASRFTVGIGKQTFYAQVDQEDEKAAQIAKNAMTMNAMAEDAQNGIQGFLDKKPLTTWKNR